MVFDTTKCSLPQTRPLIPGLELFQSPDSPRKQTLWLFRVRKTTASKGSKPFSRKLQGFDQPKVCYDWNIKSPSQKSLFFCRSSLGALSKAPCCGGAPASVPDRPSWPRKAQALGKEEDLRGSKDWFRMFHLWLDLMNLYEFMILLGAFM